ncbi:hypothetical protein [Streptomyces sp. NPDC023588]|uniref:hypothetical protein n=1 Tax=Streptomyces sp. NPDC023588 TaxID=3154907 RepID=UPI0033EAD9BE
MPTHLLSRAFTALGGCAVAFFIVLGLMAALPPAVRDAVPDGVLGGIVITLGLTAARRLTRRSR